MADHFLSQHDCRGILTELEYSHWHPSLTYRPQTDGSYRNELTRFRVSETAHQEWFSAELNAQLALIEDRLCDAMDIRRDHLEGWQATRYQPGGRFDYHLDAGYWDDHPAGDRILTILLYLISPQRGGGTHFRALDVTVEAKAGRLLLWDNLFATGDANHRMIHSSVPVLRGVKATLVTWQRQRRYRIGRWPTPNATPHV